MHKLKREKEINMRKLKRKKINLRTLSYLKQLLHKQYMFIVEM